MKSPDFLIIGAQKAGTSSLRKFLERNTEYFFTPRHELHFWNRDQQYRNGDGVKDYFNNFRDAKDSQLIGEKSPSYLPSVSAAERISFHLPLIKIVAILREPADRAYSAYLHGRRIGAIPKERTFSIAIRDFQNKAGIPYGDVVSQGFYFDGLKRYFENFDKSQIHVISFSQLTLKPEQVLPKFIDFVTPNDFNFGSAEIDYTMPRVNVARSSRFPGLVRRIRGSKHLTVEQKNYLSGLTFKKINEPEIGPEDRSYLEGIYREQNSSLKLLLGNDFVF